MSHGDWMEMPGRASFSTAFSRTACESSIAIKEIGLAEENEVGADQLILEQARGWGSSCSMVGSASRLGQDRFLVMGEAAFVPWHRHRRR